MEENLTNTPQQDVVVMSRGLDTSCAINLQGASITSWRIMGQEQLSLGRLAKIKYGYTIRGGIQLAFPYYTMWHYSVRYGFSRLMRWYQFIEQFRHPNGDVECAFIMPPCSFSRSMYSRMTWLAIWILLCERELRVRFYVCNADRHLPQLCGPMLMANFNFIDVRNVTVHGLEQCSFYVDKYGCDFFQEPNEPRKITEAVHHVYVDTPDLRIEDPLGHRRITILKDMPDISLWNPWNLGGEDQVCCHDLKPEHEDYVEGQHLHMLRIGVGIADDHITLKPNQHFVGRVIFRVEDTRGVRDPCQPQRIVPQHPEGEEPHLPNVGDRVEHPVPAPDAPISEKRGASVTDVPYMLVEELLSKAMVKPPPSPEKSVKRESIEALKDFVYEHRESTATRTSKFSF